MRGVNSSAWTEHFDESKESLQKIVGITRELLAGIGAAVSNYETEIQSLDSQIEKCIADGGEDAKLFRALGITHSYTVLRQQLDALAGQPEVLYFAKTKNHNDEPNIIAFMLCGEKLAALHELAPELSNSAEAEYLRFAKNGRTDEMLASLQKKLGEISAANKNVAALRDLLRIRKKTSKKILNDLFPEFYFLASSYYLAMAEMDINFVEGPFKAAMIEAGKEGPHGRYSRKTLRVLEKELATYESHKLDGVRQAYRLAGQIASSHYRMVIAESITRREGSSEDVASRPSLSAQIEGLQKLLVKDDAGVMHG